MKLKVNDKVQVVLGKDSGKTGKITQILGAKNRVIVEGINTYKRHIKRQNEQNPGGIVEIERPMDVAKVQLICPSCKKLTRVGYKVTKTSKQRVCKKCQATLDK